MAANACLTPLQHYTITYSATGRIYATPLQKGVRVSVAAIIATIENADTISNLERARAPLVTAKSDLAVAEHFGAAEMEDIES